MGLAKKTYSSESVQELTMTTARDIAGLRTIRWLWGSYFKHHHVELAPLVVAE